MSSLNLYSLHNTLPSCLIGVCLQVLNAYGKVYPTPPPSRRPIRVKQARLAAEKAARQGHEEEVDGTSTAKAETDKAGRHMLGTCATFLSV